MSTTWIQPAGMGRRLSGRTIPTGAWEVAALLLVGLALLGGWRWSAAQVALTVDGHAHITFTHRTTIDRLLLDVGLIPGPNDRVVPGLQDRPQSAGPITVDRARSVRFLVDGQDRILPAAGDTVGAALESTGVLVSPYDRVILDGQRVEGERRLPPLSRSVGTFAVPFPWRTPSQNPPVIQIERAIPILVDDGGLPFTIQATAPTVGEALRQAEMTLYLGDLVQPSLGSPISTGLRIFIQRSSPLRLFADGQEIKTRVQGQTVGDALSEMGVGLSGLDRVEPAPDQLLYDNVEIRITRVREEIEVEEEIVPFDTVFVPDPAIMIDTQQVREPGAEGITRTRYRVRYEDGAEVGRQQEDRWVAQTPAQRVIAYGQRIEPRTVTGPSGEELTYWRRIRMFATSYSAATSGVSPDKPWYGITRTGEPMRFGVVAVDPRIVPLRNRLYVPGYGLGQALDTGSAIRARSIDLGYDNDNLRLWRQWVDVYLLWPPPPSYQITWVLPNWPPLPQ